MLTCKQNKALTGLGLGKALKSECGVADSDMCCVQQAYLQACIVQLIKA